MNRTETLWRLLGARLPAVPTWTEIIDACPSINLVPDGEQRPFWSVMIPTYNCARFLKSTLSSILEQDPGRNLMQIKVIDDCSTEDDPLKVVHALGKDRIEFFRQPTNQGATKTFNTCINHARGEWIHILHGDDEILPGFYEEYEKLIESHPEAVMVFCPCVFIDHENNYCGQQELVFEKDKPLIPNFANLQAKKQHLFFPSVVVKRSAYENAHGFCTLLQHTADWNMWFRIGLEGPVLKSDKHLAVYRIHPNSDTCRATKTGVNILEYYWLLHVHCQKVGLVLHRNEWKDFLFNWSKDLMKTYAREKEYFGQMNQAKWAFVLNPSVESFLSWCKSIYLFHANKYL